MLYDITIVMRLCKEVMINLIQISSYLHDIIRFTPPSLALTLRQMLTNVAHPDLSKVDFSTH